MTKLLKFLPLFMLLLFAAIGIVLWLTTGTLFYALNFGYIGSFLCAGIFFMNRKSKYARRIVQLGVGLYMLIGLGIFGRENMQLEGFWFYLFSGLFQAAVIHYLVAKIGGPLIFGRGWCGWACWTAAFLDFLPYKVPRATRHNKLGRLRYVLFFLSLAFVGSMFIFKVQNLENIMFLAFIIGNVLYYAAGVALALVFKDNRAFCKYLCPITIFLKPVSYFSLMRLKPNQDKCVHCGICDRACPMDVNVSNPARNRKHATECILCFECANACPKGAL